MAVPKKAIQGFARWYIREGCAEGKRAITAAQLQRETGATRVQAEEWRKEMAAEGWEKVADQATRKPKPPKKRPATPECWGECGRWKKNARGWGRSADANGPTFEAWKMKPAAVGPIAVLYDSEGRKYRVQYALYDSMQLVTSNQAFSFKADPLYPKELQARARVSKSARRQIESISKKFDPFMVLAPSSSPAEGTPVVWAAESNESGRPIVLSGNGRTMATVRQYGKRKEFGAGSERRRKIGKRSPVPFLWYARPGAGAQEEQRAYTVAASRRFTSAPLAKIMPDIGGPIVVRVFSGPKSQAMKLAAASQSSASADLTTLERATGRARAAGVSDPLALGSFNWVRQIDAYTFKGFVKANRGWWAAAVELAPEGKRGALSESEAGAQYVNDILLGALTAGAEDWTPDKTVKTQDALVGALPAMWTIQQNIKNADTFPEWGLIERLPDARKWVKKYGTKRIAQIKTAVEAESRQVSLVDDSVSSEGVDPLAVALAVAIIRAGGRANPEAAAAGYIEAYIKESADYSPKQVGLFGEPEKGDPAGTLATIVRFKFSKRTRMRKNPNPKKNPRKPQWVEIGRRVDMVIVMKDKTRTIEMVDQWRLATEPGMLTIFFVKCGSPTRRNQASKKASEGWSRWTWGSDVDEVRSATRPEQGPWKTIGRIKQVYYDGRLGAEAEGSARRVHKFKKPYPLLQSGPEGFKVSRGTSKPSRYKVTDRGIVG